MALRAKAYGASRAGGFTSSSVISGRGRAERKPRTAKANIAGTAVEGATDRAYGARGGRGVTARRLVRAVRRPRHGITANLKRYVPNVYSSDTRFVRTGLSRRGSVRIGGECDDGGQ